MSAVTAFHADIKNILDKARGKARFSVNVAMLWRFSTQCVENLEEVVA